ncbi:MAG: hypothetical protein ABSH19_08955 [Opitutales bacterium]|jgi:hypothetical protein
MRTLAKILVAGLAGMLAVNAGSVNALGASAQRVARHVHRPHPKPNPFYYHAGRHSIPRPKPGSMHPWGERPFHRQHIRRPARHRATGGANGADETPATNKEQVPRPSFPITEVT